MYLDSYLSGAVEVDVDCLSDGKNTHVAGIMQHIEEAGVHSGDSACSLPPYSLSAAMIAEIRVQTEMLAKALNVVGLMNIQFAVLRALCHLSPKQLIQQLRQSPPASWRESRFQTSRCVNPIRMQMTR